MELTIKGEVYEFKFGIGFVRDINPTVQRTESGQTEDVGLMMAIAQLIDGNVLTLVDVLFKGNKGFRPRVSVTDIEEYIEDPGTDIDALFSEVLDFLETSNATKKTAAKMKKIMEETIK